MVLLLRKLYLYFTKDPEGVHYFPGGVSNFFQGGGGVQMLISLETQDNLQIYYSSASAKVLSKGTEPR